MRASGMFFVARCSNKACMLRGKDAGVYIGQGRTFDFIKERRLSICGACNKGLTDIVNVLFVGCRWSYRGMLEGGRIEASQESRAEPAALFPVESKAKRWKWLKLTVLDIAPVNALVQTDEKSLASVRRVDAENQTDAVSRDSQSDTCNRAALEVMTQDYHRLRSKYKALKESSL